MGPGWQAEAVVSAGGIVYRRRNGRVEFVLCGLVVDSRGRPYWGFPKGTPNENEDLEETALREVEEETGLKVRLEGPAGSSNYWFTRPGERVRYNKRVYYYLMAPVGGRLEEHDAEFDEVRWFEAQEALRALTYQEDVEVATKALQLLESKQPV